MDNAEKKLAFANVVKGVPSWQVAEAMRASVEDVERAFHEVLRRVRVWTFRRGRGCKHPTEKFPDGKPKVVAFEQVFATTLAEAQAQRVACLAALDHIDLEKTAPIRDVQHEVVNMDNAMAIRKELGR